MRILLFGKNGQLGWELNRSLITLGELTVLDYPEVDFNRPQTLPEIVRATRPDVIVNAVAYTDVDRAESEPEIASRVNADAVAEIARTARSLGALLVHYSTDYVFDGTKGSPYVETDPTHPLNVYGRTKLAGEEAAALAEKYLTLRTSWVYSSRGGFVGKVLEWAKTRSELRVVDDQISGPTSARLLAEVTALILARAGEDPYRWFDERAGIYHCAGDGACSRYEWAQKILELDPNKDKQKVQKLERAKSSEFPTPATRPMVSVLSNDKLEQVFGLRPPIWEVGLALTMGG